MIVHWVGTLFPSFPHPLWSGGTTQGVGFFQHVFGFIQGFLARLLLTERTLHARGAESSYRWVLCIRSDRMFPFWQVFVTWIFVIFACVHSHSVLIQVCSSASANAGKHGPMVSTNHWNMGLKKMCHLSFHLTQPDTLKTKFKTMFFVWKWWIDPPLTHRNHSNFEKRNVMWRPPGLYFQGMMHQKKGDRRACQEEDQDPICHSHWSHANWIGLVWDHWYPLVK